jgi:hypothetical protein
MPFKSLQQSKACFVSKGFNGKVDCKKWADKTNYKTLPKKKKNKMSENFSFKEWLHMMEVGTMSGGGGGGASTGTGDIAGYQRIIGSGGKKKKDKMVRRKFMPLALDEACKHCGKDDCKCCKDCGKPKSKCECPPSCGCNCNKKTCAKCGKM